MQSSPAVEEQVWNTLAVAALHSWPVDGWSWFLFCLLTPADVHVSTFPRRTGATQVRAT